MSTETMNVELISHPLCPFNQRLALSLIRLGKGRGKDFEITYVDLAGLPDWFLALSPEKKMPMLRTEGGGISFNADGDLAGFTGEFEHRTLSAGETHAAALADDLLMTMRDLFTAGDVAGVGAAVTAVMEKLRSIPADAAAVERVRTNQGDLREVVLAPVFSLLSANPALVERMRRSSPPTLVEYGHLLADHPQTRASRCPNYQEEFEKFFALFHSAYPAWQEQQLAGLAH